MKIKELPINIHIRLWGGSLNRLISSAIFPFMALYLSDFISQKFASIYLSFTVIIGFITNLIAGYAIDRLPRKKLLVVSAYFEFVTLLSMMIFIWQNWITLFIISHAAIVIISAFRAPSLKAIVQDSVTNNNKVLTYRLDYWLINLSMAVGVLIGGYFYSENKVILFILATLSSLIVAILYTIFIQETTEFINKKKETNFFKDLLNSYSNVWKDKKFVLLTFGITLIFTAEMTTSNYVAVRLHNSFSPTYILGFELDGINIYTLINLINTLIIAFFTLSFGKFIERFSLKTMLILGLFFYTIGYSLNMSANIWWLIVISIIIASIGELIYAPIFNSEQLRLIPKNKRGAYNAFSSLSQSGAELLGRLSIIIGVYLTPIMMSILLFILLIIGSISIVFSLFNKKI